MPSQFDSSDFVDAELETARKSPYSNASAYSAAPGNDFSRPPTREEVDSKMTEAQIKLAELKRAQEELERERAALEETRRRQIEFETGREEMLQALTRGTALLEEAEFAARRDAEQMAKAMADLKDALRKVQAIHEEGWSKENYSTEITRALTTIENARMEWNSARLKFDVLSGESTNSGTNGNASKNPNFSALADLDMRQLCKISLALTWPLVALGAAIFAVLLFRH
jgi:hypothetical protein